VFHRGIHEVGPPQQLRRAGDVALAEERADQRRRHGLLPHRHSADLLDLKPVTPAVLPEEGDIALPLVTEGEVVPHQ
jgi:hypothetical protein